jgi:hypothetical protein
MVTRSGKSYEYNAICDICGFAFKNTQLFKRWDGFMTCKEDWETRNLADFYDTPNDTHLLPWTRPDKQNELTWTPVFTGLTQTPGTGTITITGTYKQDIKNAKVVNFQVEIAITGNATTSAAAATVSMPVSPVSAGTVRVIDSQAVRLGTGVVSIASTGSLPNWSTVNRTIIISGSYGV